jgi:hypothetical protein
MNQRGRDEPKLMKEICTSSAMIKFNIYIYNGYILDIASHYISMYSETAN